MYLQNMLYFTTLLTITSAWPAFNKSSIWTDQSLSASSAVHSRPLLDTLTGTRNLSHESETEEIAQGSAIDDEFYHPEPGFEKFPPGTILKKRPVSLLPYLSIDNAIEAHQILVRTTDSFGSASTVVATILVPKNSHPDRVLSYQYAQNSATIGCAPSHRLQVARDVDGLHDIFENMSAYEALQKGWNLVIADYLGPKAAFMCGRQNGQAVLDAIRATLQSKNETNIEPDAKVTLWGYSGGAFATAWASQLQPSYAPELKIEGAAMGGLLSNVYNMVQKSDGKFWSGVSYAALLGLTHEFPAFNQALFSKMTEYSSRWFTLAEKKCRMGLSARLMNQKFSSFLDYASDDFFADPVIRQTILDNEILKDGLAPKIPIYIYHARHDEVANSTKIRDVVRNWCKQGTIVDFRLDDYGDHVLQYAVGLTDALDWIVGRFEGTVQPLPKCEFNEKTSTLDTSTMQRIGMEVSWLFKDMAYVNPFERTPQPTNV